MREGILQLDLGRLVDDAPIDEFDNLGTAITTTTYPPTYLPVLVGYLPPSTPLQMGRRSSTTVVLGKPSKRVFNLCVKNMAQKSRRVRQRLGASSCQGVPMETHRSVLVRRALCVAMCARWA